MYAIQRVMPGDQLAVATVRTPKAAEKDVLQNLAHENSQNNSTLPPGAKERTDMFTYWHFRVVFLRLLQLSILRTCANDQAAATKVSTT